jgi:hypothetical protein
MTQFKKTNDLYLAGYLLASGFSLESHIRQGTSTVFCFNESDKLNKLVEDYFNVKGAVNPLQYGSALRILKNIIYQKDNNNDNIQSQLRKGN